MAAELGDGPAGLDADGDAGAPGGTLLAAVSDHPGTGPGPDTSGEAGTGSAEAGQAGRTATGRALDRGDISAAHAKVIVAALRDLPDTVDAGGRDECEAELLRLAQNRTPAKLRIAARRVLKVVSSDPVEVDAHENTLVTSDEDWAWQAAAFWVKDNHDGTMTGQFTVPWLAGAQLKKIIDAMTAPRRRTGALTRDAAGTRATAGTAESVGTAGSVGTASSDGAGWKGEQLDWQHRRGVAFTELLGHLPTDHLDDKIAATIVVTTSIDTLRGQLRAAGTDVGDHVSAGDVRRLACGAGLLPLVLAGDPPTPRPRPTTPLLHQQPESRPRAPVRLVRRAGLRPPLRLDRAAPPRPLGIRRAHRPHPRHPPVRTTPPLDRPHRPHLDPPPRRPRRLDDPVPRPPPTRRPSSTTLGLTRPAPATHPNSLARARAPPHPDLPRPCLPCPDLSAAFATARIARLPSGGQQGSSRWLKARRKIRASARGAVARSTTQDQSISPGCSGPKHGGRPEQRKTGPEHHPGPPVARSTTQDQSTPIPHPAAQCFGVVPKYGSRPEC
ncbi:uncharacterized protein DUF222 [Knoellia remsis]|uniref:Uncharacterized protein DUF222 n=2 Tax=Knoellia remsis TaxID=407159 RepID=A0A2T0U7W2_9MICO|nr:uncharacterized protein DUF222 [Knoellia remsis]